MKEKPKATEGSDPASMIAMALKRKFANRVLYSPLSPQNPSDKENESPDSPGMPVRGEYKIFRVATVREKYLENEIFSRSGNFVNWQGNLEGTLKVREKSGNLKWQCQADSENLFILFKEGKKFYTFS